MRPSSILAALLVAASAGIAPQPAGAATDVRLISEPLVEDLPLPTALAQTPAGTFVIGTKDGRIMEWDPAGEDRPRTVVDLSPDGLNDAQSDGDRGLLGIAADPGYDDPAGPGYRRLYLSYQSRRGPVGTDLLQPPSNCSLFGCPTRGVLAAAVVPPSGAAPGIETIHDAWCSESAFHGMGDLEWSADGRSLYVSVGDGVDSREATGIWDWPGDPCDDPPGEGASWKAQHLAKGIAPRGDEGSVLAFDLESLRAPATTTTAPAVVASGLRNPWRLALDAPTGDLFIANVGWFRFEEVDRVSAADIAAGTIVNSGWPCNEGPPGYVVPAYGTAPFCDQLRDSGAIREPWLHYGDGTGPAAMDVCPTGRTAGPLVAVREDSPLPLGVGSGLLVADFVRGCAWMASRPAPGEPIAVDTLTPVPAELPEIVDAVQAGDGRLHWIAIAEPEFTGPGSLNVLRTGVVARISARPAEAAGATAQLSASGSETSADPGLLDHAWDLDGDGQFDDASGALAQVTVPGGAPVPVAVRVTDALGRSDVALSRAVVGTAPSITLESEPAGVIVPGGSAVSVRSVVSDPDGDAAAGRTTWSVEIEHCPNVCHSHPILSTAGESITFTAEPHGTLENSFYRVVARYTDPAGLEAVASREVRVSETAPQEPPGDGPPAPGGQEPTAAEPATTTPPDDPDPAAAGPEPAERERSAPAGRRPPAILAGPTRSQAVGREGLERVVHRIRVLGPGRYRLVLQDARTGRTLVQSPGSAIGTRRAGRHMRLLGTVIRPGDLGARGARALVVVSRVRSRAAPVRLLVRRVGGPRPRGALIRGGTVRALR